MIRYEVRLGKDNNPKQLIRKKYNLLKANWSKFTEELEVHAEAIMDQGRINYDEVAKVTRKVARRCIPYGYRQGAQPLWSAELTAAQKALQKGKEEMLQNPTADKVAEYKIIEQETLEYMRVEREKLFVKSIEDLKPQDNRLWMYVSRYNKPLPPPKNSTLKVEGKILKTDKQKAKAFIKHYCKVSTAKDERFSAPQVRVRDSVFNPFTEWEYQTAKDMMANGKAPGPDEIHAEMIKHFGPKMNRLLLNILNKSLKTGDVPRVWKTGHIIPIPKPNKSLDDIESFRPITLTSHVAKIIERMVAHRVLHMIEGKINPVWVPEGKIDNRCFSIPCGVHTDRHGHVDTTLKVNTEPKSAGAITVCCCNKQAAITTGSIPAYPQSYVCG